MWDTEPVFTDENLAVYALPLWPEAAVSEPEGMATKRTEQEAALDPSVIPSKKTRTFMDPSIHTNLYSYEEFNPTALQGEKAEEWNNLLIRRMFKIKSPFPKTEPDAQLSERSELEQYLVFKYTHLPLPPHIYQPIALCYFGAAKPVRGKFDDKRANELGVPRGPMRRLLTRGQTITLDDGTVVTPEMCVHPPEPPAVSARYKLHIHLTKNRRRCSFMSTVLTVRTLLRLFTEVP
jgi:ribonuclease Z